jgi:hypothetical protein
VLYVFEIKSLMSMFCGNFDKNEWIIALSGSRANNSFLRLITTFNLKTKIPLNDDDDNDNN